MSATKSVELDALLSAMLCEAIVLITSLLNERMKSWKDVVKTATASVGDSVARNRTGHIVSIVPWMFAVSAR